MKKSLWQKDNNLNELKSVEENLKTDILIIGAGITGISTAYNLIKSDYKIILIDRGKCFNGATAKSTGKITYMQDLKYQEICNVYDYETAKLYYQSQKEAIKILQKNIKENNVDCNFEKNESVTFTTNIKDINKFHIEERLLDSFGVKYSNNSKHVDNEVKYLISVKDAYVFNPVKYLKGLLRRIKKSINIEVYENSAATEIKKENNYYIVCVNNKEIRASKIVIACNYPFFTIPGLIPLRTYLERSYITATKIDYDKKVNGITNTYPYQSFRFYNDKGSKYLIYLSNSSIISDNINYLKNYNENIMISKKITNKPYSYKWTNMDVMTNDFLPLIGAISDDHKDIFIATGYNTWGMTNATIASKLLFDLIRNKKNKYQKLFSLDRKINVKIIKNFFINTFRSNIKAYVLNMIIKNPSWYKNKAYVTRMNNKRVGVYCDENGNEHIVSNICPHLKCFLTFNEVDKTWDCPCHGSRFDTNGNVINGPSKYDIKIDETKS